MMQRLVITVPSAAHLGWVARSTLLLPLFSFCSCGGEEDTGAGTETPAPYDPCEESRTLDTLMIADFEDVPPVSWFTGSDGTAPPEQLDPVPPGTATTPLEAAKCSEDAAPGFGFHIVATGLQSYGYSFEFNTLNPLQADEPRPAGQNYFDTLAGGWDGLSMWVRKGSPEFVSASGEVEPYASSIFASVSERFTEPAGAALFSDEEENLLLSTGAYCAYNAVDVDGDDVVDPLLSQCDRFGAGVGIATEWRFYKVPFSRMRQRAYGRPSVLPGPDSKIIGLNFGLDGENWDFWIDDLAFYREPEADAVAQ